MNRPIVILVLALLLISAVSATMISPARKSFVLQPGSVSQYQLRIINDQDTPLKVSIRSEGTLEAHLNISPQEFTVESGERLIDISLVHPEERLLRPGRNRLRLLVSAGSAEEGQFSGAVTLIHNLDLIRLYDGAFLEGSIATTEERLALGLNNLGRSATTAQASATIGNRSLALGSTQIPGEGTGKLEGKLPPLPFGAHQAEVLLSYRDPLSGVIDLNFTHMFMKGNPAAILSAPDGAFHAGSISEIGLPISLRWNVPVEAYADLRLLQEGEQRTAVRTAVETLLPAKIVTIPGFVDLTNLAPGDYLFEVTIRSTGGAILSQKNFTVELMPPTPPSATRAAASHPVTLLLVSILTLLLFALVLAWRRRRRK